MWIVEFTDQFQEWFLTLREAQQDAIEATVNVVITDGPGLGRPLVDTIKGSCHSNMKELRPLGTHIRILFIFDPRRSAILLVGGDKTNRWRQWYEETIPIAEALYDEHLRLLKEEGLL